MQVDGIWERDGLRYNPFVAQLLSRKQYYVLRRNIRPDVVEVLEECNGQWAGAWRLGGAACGDESVGRTKAYVPAHCGCSSPASPTPPASSSIALPMPPVGTWWTCTCTRVDAGTCGGLATVRATTMPSRS